MDLGLKGKRALVTGSTRGIGRAIASALLDEGATVAICCRYAAGVEQAIKSLGEKGKVVGASVDVANGDALRTWIADSAAALGGLDIVVSNVSAGGGGRTSIEAWRQNFEVDMLGTVHTVEAARPFLEKSGEGAITIISSTAAVEAFRVPQPYNVMKAGLINYAKNLSIMLAPKQIRVNTICPGPIYFKGGAWENIKTNMPAVYEGALSQIALGRMGTAEDVAAATLYLSSPVAGYVTGANLILDGGFTKRVNF
ncbi:MAG: SDR family oxidoreductase [Alphaproteobacteria bacterium]|nr:SDR family oxidoreductase [Alphaproteobacteria bacterium]